TSRAPKTFGFRVLHGVLVLLILWNMALLPLGCVSMGAGNPTDLRWATCHVTDATAERTNDDEHPWRIVIDSEDCPTLVYTDGLTEDNADELAGTFEQAPYEVRVHESAIDVDGGIRYAKELKIHSYRPAPEIAD
ncbi:MAG: hypothetical protein L0K38_12610, partial [Yaniella sp.]|uniref:hypothetical protein n=1 Tax=Yaniella sp. TaxID=2773929 RepID=UPI0026486D2E